LQSNSQSMVGLVLVGEIGELSTVIR
jgi:hypothetical protein